MSDERVAGPVDTGEGQITRLSTISGGKPCVTVDKPAADREIPDDLVHRTLQSAQGIAASGRRVARRGRRHAADTGGGYSGAGPDRLDPAPVGDVLAGLFAARGWEQPVNEARIFADWPGLVGPEIAAHCQPVSLTGGELRLAAKSTAWATQLRLLAGSVLARLVAELGPTVVTRLHITGPVAPSWSHGLRSVRGGRGPRDTYG